MARNRRKRRSKKSRLNWRQAVGWFIGGIGLGLAVVAPLVWLGGESGSPDGPPTAAGGTSPPATKAPPPHFSARNMPRKKRIGRREEPPKEATTATPEQDGEGSNPEYRFYTLLPNMETDVPKREAEEADGQAAAPADQPALPRPTDEGDFVIQVASFREQEEAEGLKARLALRGLHAEIQERNLDAKGIWYRVRLGPYTDRPAAEAVRDRLEKAGMEVLITRR